MTPAGLLPSERNLPIGGDFRDKSGPLQSRGCGFPKKAKRKDRKRAAVARNIPISATKKLANGLSRFAWLMIFRSKSQFGRY